MYADNCSCGGSCIVCSRCKYPLKQFFSINPLKIWYNSKFAQELYFQLYFEFSNGVQRQEIIAALIGHAASHTTKEGTSHLYSGITVSPDLTRKTPNEYLNAFNIYTL